MWPQPALTAMAEDPSEAPTKTGESDQEDWVVEPSWENWLEPQQATEPLSSTAHACSPPAEIATTALSGASMPAQSCPEAPGPMQAIEPLESRAQTWFEPATTAVAPSSPAKEL